MKAQKRFWRILRIVARERPMAGLLEDACPLLRVQEQDDPSHQDAAELST